MGGPDRAAYTLDQAGRMQDEYRTVARADVPETEVNRSRVLCALAPAATEREVQDFVADVHRGAR